MSKRRLCITVLLFILVIALVVGASYLVSMLLKKYTPDKSVGSPTNPVYFILDTNPNIK